MVEITVESSLTNGLHRVYPEWTLSGLAHKFEFITGIPPESQKIVVTGPEGGENSLFTLEKFDKDNDTQLRTYEIPEQAIFHVLDTRDPEHQLDLSGEPAYREMSREEYEKLPGTAYQYRKEHKLGRFSDEYQQRLASVRQTRQEELTVKLDEECYVTLSSGQRVRGIVAFIGEVETPGIRVGVRLFTPEGKNNGVVRGVHLFDAEPNHGILVWPNAVKPLKEDELEL